MRRTAVDARTRSTKPARRALALVLSIPAVLSGAVRAGGSGTSDVAGDLRAGAVHVAVAANFADAFEELVSRFEAGTGHRVVSSLGSTGQLYAQIRNGAPFEIFLAADTLRPSLLEQSGDAVRGTRFTYATGRLALLSSVRRRIGALDVELRDASNRRIAIANPRTAPYGGAAVQVLERLGVQAATADRIVRGENIAQTFQFVKSGAAELGFVAYSQAVGEPTSAYVLVPAMLHDRIAQDAVLLRAGASNPAALSFLAFLRGEVANRVIRAHGYDAS